jgi:hypothetical protein
MSERNAVNFHSLSLKKYKTRKSPPFSANKNCGKSMEGNDGNIYVSKPNKNGVCKWIKK